MERPRPRGRLTRSERVASPLGAATSPLSANSSPSGPFSQSSAWQLFIRDSLLHIAWPISLSSDGEVSDRAVRIRYIEL
ncbi:hypothetical protein GE061_002115 [Apolygus lucorum]|uniref:Uncharacterized protein n=1 Tax=Apolygus lucorum TaxID=248454 RepID=A0A8S9X3R1_APOLU|nr:hypothetical protein GE061_002115 [Apolygus lucorum]